MSSRRVPDAGCSSKHVTSKIFDYSIPSLNETFVWTHKDCVCNEKIALEQRHQFDDGARFSSNVDLGAELAPWVRPLERVSYDHVISHATSSKRRLLEEAKESLEVKPFESDDGKVKMFLKPDKDHKVKYTTPRCIQYRSKRYCLPLASYLIPIEKMVYTWTDASESPIFAKSRNMVQRGSDIRSKMDHFRDPVAISLDHSKFDSHCNVDLLRVEHGFYQACFPRDRFLQRLLKLQLVNKGVTKNGTRYVTHGTRMSGDQNTGLGNSIINYAMTKAMQRSLKVEMCFYIDGDDFIIFVEREHEGMVNPDWYEQFGMKTKLDSKADEMEGIEFCQCRPVFNGIGYTMVRNPRRMLARLNWVVGEKHPKHLRNYMTSIGLCGMALGMGLPVEQYVGKRLAELGGRYIITPQHHSANKMPMRPCKARIVEPSIEVRESYEKAWDIPVMEQIELERVRILKVNHQDYEDYDEEPFRRMH